MAAVLLTRESASVVSASSKAARQAALRLSPRLLAAALECVGDLSQIDAFVDSFIAGAAESGTVLSREEARCAIQALELDDVDAAILECLGERAGSADGPGSQDVASRDVTHRHHV